MNDRRKVLVVEDNELNLELVTDLLEAHGYGVLQARNGNEALELASREQPDLILMDIQLPEMDGLEVTRLLKQNADTRHIAVVALTAHAMRGDEGRARRAGCSGYITKPIDTRGFARAVENYIEGEAGQEG